MELRIFWSPNRWLISFCICHRCTLWGWGEREKGFFNFIGFCSLLVNIRTVLKVGQPNSAYKSMHCRERLCVKKYLSVLSLWHTLSTFDCSSLLDRLYLETVFLWRILNEQELISHAMLCAFLQRIWRLETTLLRH